MKKAEVGSDVFKKVGVMSFVGCFDARRSMQDANKDQEQAVIVIYLEVCEAMKSGTEC